MSPPHPHADVADRFRFFLRAVDLSREQFAGAVDGAIEARSLFSVLNGSRRPSRALAVLIEQRWGFRADFLLEGRGEMWAKPGAASDGAAGASPRGLSAAEAEVVEFMRASVDNARSLREHLEEARIWSRLLGRGLSLSQDLATCGRSGDARDLRAYPLLARRVYDEHRVMADRYEQLVVLLHRRRVHRLQDDLLRRLLGGLPGTGLAEPERLRLQAMLEALLERRRERLRGLDESLERLRETVENLCRMGPVRDQVEALSAASARRRQHELVERLASLAPDRLPPEVEHLLADLDAGLDPAAICRSRLRRLLRNLLTELEDDPAVRVETESVEELRARYDAALEPLAI